MALLRLSRGCSAPDRPREDALHPQEGSSAQRCGRGEPQLEGALDLRSLLRGSPCQGGAQPCSGPPLSAVPVPPLTPTGPLLSYPLCGIVEETLTFCLSS